MTCCGFHHWSFSTGIYRRSLFKIRPNILIGLQKLRLRPKDRSRSRLFIIFAVSRTGTVGSTEHWVTVPKCLHKIPKSIKNSAKVHQNPLKIFHGNNMFLFLLSYLSVFNGFWWTFAEFLMDFGVLCKHFGIVTQCLVDPTVPVLLTAKMINNRLRLKPKLL